MRKKLNIRQEKFCQAYVRLGNATAAMLEAYPTRQNWGDDTKNNAAYKLLKNGDVLARVEELRREAKEASDVTRDEILGILARVIRGEKITDYEQMTVNGPASRDLSVAWAIERLCKMCGFDQAEKREVRVDTSSREELEKELMRLEMLTD